MILEYANIPYEIGREKISQLGIPDQIKVRTVPLPAKVHQIIGVNLFRRAAAGWTGRGIVRVPGFRIGIGIGEDGSSRISA